MVSVSREWITWGAYSVELIDREFLGPGQLRAQLRYSARFASLMETYSPMLIRRRSTSAGCRTWGTGHVFAGMLAGLRV